MAVFYRKYRPQKFNDLIGQDAIVATLLSQLTKGNVAHGYLFAGSRGTGKTSTARIFAKAINCQKSDIDYRKSGQTKTKSPKSIWSGEPCDKCPSCLSIINGSDLDLIEIDAASNRGIDEIRDLREKIKLSPISSRFKVYIIDEVHMLTNEAFNALLKTLEEPPAHAIFILCTTAPNKLPTTIISRLMRFNFKRASKQDITKAISKISRAEKIQIDNDALLEISKSADGSYRDAISILDQLAASGRKIKKDDVIFGGFSAASDQLNGFVTALIEKDLKTLALTVSDISKRGGDISYFTTEVIEILEKILLLKIGFFENEINTEIDENLSVFEKQISFGKLTNLMKILLVAEGEIKNYPSAKIPLLLAACKWVGGDEDVLRESEKEKEKTDEIDVVEVLADKSNEVKVSREKGRDSAYRGKNSAKLLLEIENKWGDFLSKVRPVNAHLVALLRSTRPSEFDGVNLKLDVFWRFHKEKLEEPKILTLLEKFLEDVYGRKIRLILFLSQRESKLPKIVQVSDVADVSSEELSKLAQEIFSK